jgi:hypothetical protein
LTIQLKDTYQDRKNPYSKGCIENFNRIYCNDEKESSLLLETFSEMKNDQAMEETLLNRLENKDV